MWAFNIEVVCEMPRRDSDLVLEKATLISEAAELCKMQIKALDRGIAGCVPVSPLVKQEREKLTEDKTAKEDVCVK